MIVLAKTLGFLRPVGELAELVALTTRNRPQVTNGPTEAMNNLSK